MFHMCTSLNQSCIHLSFTIHNCVLWVTWNMGNNHPGDGSSIFITMVECFICIQVHNGRYVISLFSAIVQNLSLWNEIHKVQDICSESVLNSPSTTCQSGSHRFSYWMSYSEAYDLFLLVIVSLPVAMIEWIINLLSLLTVSVLFLYLFSNYLNFLFYKVTCFPTLHSGFSCVISDEGSMLYNTSV